MTFLKILLSPSRGSDPGGLGLVSPLYPDQSTLIHGSQHFHTRSRPTFIHKSDYFFYTRIREPSYNNQSTSFMHRSKYFHTQSTFIRRSEYFFYALIRVLSYRDQIILIYRSEYSFTQVVFSHTDQSTFIQISQYSDTWTRVFLHGFYSTFTHI